MKKALIIPSSGIGDALLMMIAAHHNHLAGYETFIAHSKISELSSWFPHIHFIKQPEDLFSYTLIILQNDNSSFSKEIIALRETKKFPLHVFYPSYKPSKHGLLKPFDVVFNPEKTMVENCVLGCKKLFPSLLCTSDIGILFPKNLHHKKEKKRIVLHPTSKELFKNWPAKKFLSLAKKLKEKGFDPVFTVSEEEYPQWKSFLENQEIKLPLLNNLSDFASFLYESAFFIGNDSLGGHLASCLMIPTITLAAKKDHIKLWRPGWARGSVVLPSDKIPNRKLFFRLRERYWTWWISPSRVLRQFLKDYSREKKSSHS